MTAGGPENLILASRLMRLPNPFCSTSESVSEIAEPTVRENQ